MNEKKLNIGVVGVGHLGKWHAQQLQAIPAANLTGVFDIDSRRAEEVAAEFHTRAFSSFESLLEKVDALSIVTPTTTHYDFARQALKNGKHIFLEKPITESVEQGEELVDMAQKEHLKIQVGHIERFNPAILALENILINPLFIESHRLSNFNPRGTDVAVVLDLMIHDIDLILSFVHSPVKEIHASGVGIISPTEDIANCRLEFENGCVANVTASRISTRKMRKMRFFQPNSYISVDFLEGASEIYHLSDKNEAISTEGIAISIGQIEKDNQSKEIRYSRLEKKDINPLNYELSLFVNSVLEDKPVAVSGEQGVRALRVARSILKKINEHSQSVKEHWRL